MVSASEKLPQRARNQQKSFMDDLLTLAIGKLADHYQVSEDYLRRALLLRAVAELNAVTDRSKPATPEQLEVILTNLNRQLNEVLEGFRRQIVEADNAVQSAHIAIAVVERVAGVLRGQTAGPPLPSAGSR
jgi:hypothetical protein